MSHVPNELHDVFPGKADAIHELKMSHAHFARLAEEHHVVNHEIHRAETKLTPMDDLDLEKLKKKRLIIQDQIEAMLDAKAR